MREPQGIRLNKAIADTGFCSRREADRLIEEGRVSINGVTAGLGAKVMAGDELRVNGKALKKKDKQVYIMLNKPVGIICVTDPTVRNNIVDHVGHPQRIFPVGRLDKASEGLILLTNDGDIVNKILRAGNLHEKEYVVRTNKTLTDEFLKKMASGVPILGTMTKKCVVKKTGPDTFRIILTQGLNRQIRRMCEYFGYEVLSLKRLRIMHLRLGNLRPGQWRDLTMDELNKLNSAVAHSVKTEEASRDDDWGEA